jgi:hypothetical protein
LRAVRRRALPDLQWSAATGSSTKFMAAAAAFGGQRAAGEAPEAVFDDSFRALAARFDLEKASGAEMKQERDLTPQASTSTKARGGVLLVLVAASAAGSCDGNIDDFIYKFKGGRYDSQFEEDQAREERQRLDELVRPRLENQSLEQSSSKDSERPSSQTPPADPQNPPL